MIQNVCRKTSTEEQLETPRYGRQDINKLKLQKMGSGKYLEEVSF